MTKREGRADRPIRRMGTEVIADRRTRRVRDRGQAEADAYAAARRDKGAE